MILYSFIIVIVILKYFFINLSFENNVAPVAKLTEIDRYIQKAINVFRNTVALSSLDKNLNIAYGFSNTIDRRIDFIVYIFSSTIIFPSTYIYMYSFL